MEEKNKFNKKLLIYGLLILLVGVLIGIFSQNKKNTTPNVPKTPEKQTVTIKKEIKIAQIPLAFATAFPLFVAQQEGFFEKYNLTVKFEQMNRSLSVQALLAKTVDYTPFVEEATIASLKDAPVKTVMIFAENPSFCLVIRPGVKPEDIKRVVLGQGTWGHFTALKLFKEMNISPEFIFIPGLAEAKSMLAAKSADATTMAVPTAFQLQTQGYTIIELFDKEALFGLVTTDDKIKSNPEEIKSVIKAMQSAIDFIQNNPEKTKELLFTFYKYDKSEANNKLIENTYAVGKKIFKNIKIPNPVIIKEMVQIEKNVKFENLKQVTDQTVSPEDLTKAFDFRFIK